MGNIEIIKRGVTKMDLDAIVNAANEDLLAGGGVCGAIFAEAGHDDLQDACNKIGHCDTGDAVATPGFRLSARYIIHAVGPIWIDGAHGEPKLLASAYIQSLERARELGCHSIAFPLISSGIFGYPKEEAWQIALSTCQEWQVEHANYEMLITFCVLSEDAFELGLSIHSKLCEQGSDQIA